MILTSDNYYSLEADREYMSCSQYQDFLSCEARAMAKIDGRFIPEPSEAFVVGNYFHTAMESPEAYDEFCQMHFEEIFKTKVDKKTGEIIPVGKYAAFEKAQHTYEKTFRLMLIIILVEAILIFASNCAWLIYLNQFDFPKARELTFNALSASLDV